MPHAYYDHLFSKENNNNLWMCLQCEWMRVDAFETLVEIVYHLYNIPGPTMED